MSSLRVLVGANMSESAKSENYVIFNVHLNRWGHIWYLFILYAPSLQELGEWGSRRERMEAQVQQQCELARSPEGTC